MKSTMPVRGRAVMMTALIALLVGVLFAATDASAQSAGTTGGFSSEPPPAPEPTAEISMAPDGRTAIAPAGAPEAVVKAVAAANRLTRKPYKWGGGHGRWRDSGYDCSGAVSYVLHAAGLGGGLRVDRGEQQTEQHGGEGRHGHGAPAHGQGQG